MPKPTPDDLKAVFGLKPEKAIEYFRNKGYAISWNWKDVWQEAQANAFTVARVSRLDILQDIRAALDKALANGTTLQEFNKELIPILKAKGWWGPMIDPDTGEITTYHPGSSRPIDMGTPARLKTIYQTNLQTSYMAGRYADMMANTGNRPGKRNWWMYVAVMDDRTRPSHAALNGRVFRFDDPIWDYIYPPNGFNCRCRVIAYTDKDLERLGITPDTSDGYITKEMVQNRDGSPSERVSIKLPGMERAFSPDLGWAYNPATSQSAALQEIATQSLDVSNSITAAEAIHDMVNGPAFKLFYEHPEGKFPIGVLQDEAAAKIGAKTHTVILSADTMKKQLSVHPELAINEYAFVQEAFSLGQEIKENDNSIIYLYQDKGYVTVVKATQSGNAVYLTSFRRLSADEVKREREIRRLLDKVASGGASQPVKDGNPT